MVQEVGATVAPASPGEPPERVCSELLWRLAARLYHDHACGLAGAGCVACRQPWPCSGRRLAELGLIRALPSTVRDQRTEGSRDIREPASADGD